MAGDWIKMRVSLPRDPKVIAMADWLAGQREFMDWLTDPVRCSCKNSAYDHVTRNVTVALCVTALLVTWGMARERGDRDDDDLVLECCDLETISAVAGIPFFGQAMGFVKWAKEEPNQILRLSGFFKDHESPDEKFKRQNAQRQARFRENKARNESNVTITHREEKSSTPSRTRKTRAPAAKSNGEPKSAQVWNAYSTAFMSRYGVEPVRNMAVNSQLSKLVDRLGATEAPSVAAFYVTHNKAFYVGANHSTSILLRDAEGLRKEWATGNQTTETQARKLDQGQAQGSVWAKLQAEGKP